MTSFQDYMCKYTKQLEKGDIQKAYKGLMEYIMSLRTHLQKSYPSYSISGSIYQGYLDMSYFSFTPETLRQRRLKIAIVFIHEACRFEVWLGGFNKRVQTTYWKLFKDNGWDRYHLVPTIEGRDSIVERRIIERPDFNDLEQITAIIERETMAFISVVETFLSKHHLNGEAD